MRKIVHADSDDLARVRQHRFEVEFGNQYLAGRCIGQLLEYAGGDRIL